MEDKYLTGDIFLVNREILDNVGFYDTNTFTGYFSDHDFSSRVISSGYLCVLAQGAFAFHHQARANGACGYVFKFIRGMWYR